MNSKTYLKALDKAALEIAIANTLYNRVQRPFHLIVAERKFVAKRERQRNKFLKRCLGLKFDRKNRSERYQLKLDILERIKNYGKKRKGNS